MSFTLHVLGQVPLRLEAEVTILASERSHVGVGPDVFLQHIQVHFYYQMDQVSSVQKISKNPIKYRKGH